MSDDEVLRKFQPFPALLNLLKQNPNIDEVGLVSPAHNNSDCNVSASIFFSWTLYSALPLHERVHDWYLVIPMLMRLSTGTGLPDQVERSA